MAEDTLECGKTEIVSYSLSSKKMELPLYKKAQIEKSR